MVNVHVADHELTAPERPAEADLGELEAYPLRRASQICKASGGGRWAPKPPLNLIGDHLPGQKPQYLIELEREEEERRRQKANPVYVHGGMSCCSFVRDTVGRTLTPLLYLR